ncbi:MAG: DUF5050 domain-containing protein [Candidatus Omnitrophica bacterium]|nr:DUF5050 domain-containing protein [Candidatus Omnitrophota bacterium]
MNRKLFKIIAFILVHTFLIMDFAWSGANEIFGENQGEQISTLSPHVYIDTKTFQKVCHIFYDSSTKTNEKIPFSFEAGEKDESSPERVKEFIPPVTPFKHLRGLMWAKYIRFAKIMKARGIDEEMLKTWFSKDAAVKWGNKKTSLAKAVKSLEPVRVETHIYQQSGRQLSAASERIDNASEDILKGNGIHMPIGQFGEGALQAVRLLDKELISRNDNYEGDYVIWTTSALEDKGKQSRRIMFYKMKGKECVDFEERKDNCSAGTKVQVRSEKLKGRREELDNYLRAAYEDSDQVKIYLNGELINENHGLIDLYGKAREHTIRDKAVFVNTYDDGFEIIDEGKGMDREVLLTKLPVPRRGSNQQIRKDAKDDLQEEAGTIFRHEEMIDTRYTPMKVRYVVGSRAITGDMFEVKNYGTLLPKKIVMKISSLATLTDTKDEIIIDNFMMKTAARLITRIVEAPQDDKFALINAFSQIVKHLQDKISAKEHSLTHLFVDRIKKEILIPYMQRHNVIYLPVKEGFLDVRLAIDRKIVYLDEIFFKETDLFDMSLEEIPFFRGGEAYAIALAEEETPILLVNKETALIDKKISDMVKSTPQDAEREREIIEYLNAFLSASGVKGEFVIARENKESDTYKNILSKLDVFTKLPLLIQEKLIKKLIEGGLEESRAERILRVLKSSVEAQEKNDAGEEKTGDARGNKEELPGELKNLSASAQLSLLGNINGIEYLIAKEDKKISVFNALTGEVVLDGEQLQEEGINGDIDIRIENGRFLVDYTEETLFPGFWDADERVLKNNLLQWPALKEKGIVREEGNAPEYVYWNILSQSELKRKLRKNGFSWSQRAKITRIKKRDSEYVNWSYHRSSIYKSNLPYFEKLIELGIVKENNVGGESSYVSWIEAWNPEQKKRGKEIAQQIKNAFSLEPGVKATLSISAGDKSYAMIDLSDGKLRKIFGGGSFWIRKMGEQTFRNSQISGDSLYISTTDMKQTLIERMKIEPNLQKTTVFNQKDEELNGMHAEDFGIFFLTKKNDLRTVYFYDRNSGKLHPFALGEYKKFYYDHKEGDNYYFVGTHDNYAELINMQIDRRGALNVIEEEKVRFDEIWQMRYADRVNIWGKSIYYLRLNENKKLEVVRNDGNNVKVIAELPGFIDDMIEVSSQFYKVLQGGKNADDLRVLAVEKIESKEVSYWLLDLTKETVNFLGDSPKIGINQPSAIFADDGKILFVGMNNENERYISSEITLKEHVHNLEEETRAHNDYAEREKRLINNLLYTRVRQLISVPDQLLVYSSHRVLNALSVETLASLKLFITENPAEIDDFLKFFEAVDSVLQEYDSERLNKVVHNWIIQSQLDKEGAGEFLSAAANTYEINNRIMRGTALLKDDHLKNAPAFMRSFWMRLSMDLDEVIPEKKAIVSLFQGETTGQMENIPLARILLAKDQNFSEVNRRGLKLKDYADILENISGSEKEYDGEIKSAREGQDPTTTTRESTQNARDAERLILKKEEERSIQARIYIVKRGEGQFELVREVEDGGVGMDAWVIFNKLFPLDETTKKQNMGQGSYTIWAEAKPGDIVEVETTPGYGLGYKIKERMSESGSIIFDLIQEEKLPLYSEGGPRGSLIRQRNFFTTREEAVLAGMSSGERLQFYAGAVQDISIYLNEERINEELESVAQLRFGQMGESRFLTGGEYNRVTQDELSMPASLNVVTVRDNYWSAIPTEAQKELLSSGITTDIAPGLLLTKARTGPAFEEYWPYIRKSESLKAMLAILRKIENITNLEVKVRIIEALEQAEEAEKIYPALNKEAYYLNYEDPEAEGQRQFHFVSEEEMLTHWYQLLIRLKIDIENNSGNIQRLSLLDMYRLENGFSTKEDTYELSERFKLPQVQYKPEGRTEQARPRGKKFTYRRLFNPLSFMLSKAQNVLHEISLIFKLKVLNWKTKTKIVVSAILAVIVIFIAVANWHGGWQNEAKQSYVRERVYKDSDQFQTGSFIEKLYRWTYAVFLAENDGEVIISDEIQAWGEKLPTEEEMLRNKNYQKKWLNKIVYLDKRIGGFLSRFFPRFGQGSGLFFHRKTVYPIAKVSGMRSGEYAIVRYNPNVNGAGAYEGIIDVTPQGKYTGEVVTMDMMVRNVKKGEKIPLLQVTDGVIEDIEFDREKESFDVTTMDDGYITAKRNVWGAVKMKTHIPRRTQNNRLVFDTEYDKKWLQKEFADIPEQWRVILDPAKKKNFPVFLKIELVDDLMENYFVYNKNVTIKADGTWMNSAKRLLAARGKIETYCEQISIYKQILLEYVGEEGMSSGLYVYKGNNVLLGSTAHADNYFLSYGKVVRSSWNVGDVTVGDSVVKVSEQGKGLTIIKGILGEMIKYAAFILAGIWAIIIIKRIGVSVYTRLLERWNGRRKKEIVKKGFYKKPERKVLSKNDLLRVMKDMESSKRQRELSQKPILEDIGFFEKEIVKYVLSCTFKAISEDLAKVEINIIFDAISPRIYFKEGVLYINAAFYNQAIQNLKNYYIDTKLIDKWGVFRQWIAIALESSLLVVKGEMPLKEKKAGYYLKTILSLLKNRKEVLGIFDIFPVEGLILGDTNAKDIEKRFNFDQKARSKRNFMKEINGMECLIEQAI